MTRPKTFIEYEILQTDAARGLWYPTFDAFWEKRMEPMQFISLDATGAFADIRAALKSQAKEQFILFGRTRSTGQDLADGNRAQEPLCHE